MKSKIKTFEAACKALKIDPKALPAISNLPKKHQGALTAHYKLIIIAEALNEGWEPNWNDNDEYKYFPWFEVEADKKRPAGFGFSLANCDYWRTDTTVGSRLCYRTKELALYAGKQFAELYKEYFLII